MGLAKRIIPTLLARGDQLVKGKQFDSWRSVGHVLQAARIHAKRGVDELVVLDIGATPEGRGPNLGLIEKITADAFTPITVGGGVRTIEHVRDLLAAGADKVAICTAAFDTDVIWRASEKFGRQAIVAAIDVAKGHPHGNCGRIQFSISAKTHALMCEDHGAGEILLTAMDREGMMAGYDLDLVREIVEAVSIPVVAHGGCGTYAHMVEALEAGASGVASGAMFQFTDQTPRGAAKYLAAHGVEARV